MMSVRPGRFFTVASLVLGAALALVTPPFQVPDEPAHFYRAYLVSEGRLRLAPPGTPSDEVPASLERIASALLRELPIGSEARIHPRTVLDAFAVPLDPEVTATVWFPTGLQYTFVPYLPQAAGIGIARLFGAPALALLYAARLANLLAGTLAISLALRLLPALRWPAVLLAMMPMALALRASASIDATTIGAAFLLTAAAARLIWGRDAPRGRDLSLLTVSAAVLCATKPPYLPLALLAFAVPASRFTGRAGASATSRRAWFFAGYVALLAAVVTWSVATARAVGVVRPGVGVDATQQMAAMIADPLGFLAIAIADYGVHIPRYLGHFVGHLGWLDVRLPVWLLVAYLTALLALTLADAGADAAGGVAVTTRHRAVLAAIVGSGLLLVSAAQYATFTPLGASFIDGIQGRYFIPLALAGMWALCAGPVARRVRVEAVPATVACFVVSAFSLALRAVVLRFYQL